MDAAHTVSTFSPLDSIAPNRSRAWLACAAVILAVGCSAADDNNTTVNNTTSNNTTANNTTANNTTANNTTANNTTANNTTANNTTANNTTANNTTANNTTVTNTGGMATFTLKPLDSTSGMLVDAEVCVRGTDNCVTGTAEDVVIEVPTDTDIAVSVTSDGFVTANWYVNLSEDASYTTPLVPAANIVALLGAFGFADDASKGHVFFQAQSATAGIAGVTLTLDPATFETVLYNASTGPDPALTETSYGNGAFINVDEGPYEMTGAHATFSCAATSSHQQGAAGAAKFDVVAGEATYAFVVCE